MIWEVDACNDDDEENMFLIVCRVCVHFSAAFH